MLINFHLKPLDLITPWGQPNDYHLHWFGLTDGEYWIEVGSATLFEYAEPVRSHFRYCDYQVARLYEDILQMCPAILEPVPPDLAPFLLQYERLDHALAARYGNDSEDYWTAREAIRLLYSGRCLDSAYLRPSANIDIWSEADGVHIHWDNRNKLIDGHAAWSAQQGCAVIPRAVFLAEIRAFHEQFMREMGERVTAVVQGALPEVRIDQENLQREHAIRSLGIENYLQPQLPPTNWEEIRLVIKALDLPE